MNSAPAILVVDDETPIHAMLDAVVQDSGITVTHAASGPEAVERYEAESGRIALVLLDVNMPGMSGPQTLTALRQRDPDLRCCFMSGAAGCFTAVEAQKMGALHFFTKPFRLAELTRTVHQVLASLSHPAN
jgi:DNA-binding NtrC family response regulator